MHGLTRRKLALAGVALGCALVAGATPAAADGGPKAEILIIHATHCDKKSIDPGIGEMPGIGYECLKLLDTKTLPLKQGTPATAPLPNGRRFQVAFNGVEKNHYKITASISTPDNAGFVKLADIAAEPNKKFHVGGFSYQGGALILGIRILP
jgi:hypothetical protein